VTPPPRRRARPSTISTIGLTGAPPAAAPVAPEPDGPTPAERGNAIESALPEPSPTPDLDVTTSRGHDVTTSRGHEPTTSRRHGATTSPPAVERPVSYTVRLSVDELDAADELVRDLRRATGRRRIDRSEVIRALLALASTDERTRTRIGRDLR